MKVLQRTVGTRTLLKEGKLHSLGCDYHEACRISLFTQLLIKFRKQDFVIQNVVRKFPTFVRPRNFITVLKTARCITLRIAILRHVK